MADEKIADFYRQKPDAGIGVSEDGRPQYGGMEDAETTRLPALPGSRFDSEDVRLKNIPQHINAEVGRSLRDGGFHGPKPHVVFAHLAGSLRGAELLDEKTSARLNQLVDEFSRTPEADQEQFFGEKVRPFLNTLSRTPRATGR